MLREHIDVGRRQQQVVYIFDGLFSPFSKGYSKHKKKYIISWYLMQIVSNSMPQLFLVFWYQVCSSEEGTLNPVWKGVVFT